MGNVVSFFKDSPVKEASIKKNLMKTSEELKNTKITLQKLINNSSVILNKLIITELIFYLIYLAIMVLLENNVYVYTTLYLIISVILYYIVLKFYELRKSRLVNKIKRLENLQKKKILEFKSLTDFDELKQIIEEQEINELTVKEGEIKENQNFSSPNRISMFENISDMIIGDDPSKKYALICSNCHRHNGLVLPDDMKKKKFRCYFCKTLNE